MLDDGYIFILSSLTIEEKKFYLLHELGHLAEHRHLTERKDNIVLQHRHELEADFFACSYLVINNGLKKWWQYILFLLSNQVPSEVIVNICIYEVERWYQHLGVI